jgi:hypothetical protein
MTRHVTRLAARSGFSSAPATTGGRLSSVLDLGQRRVPADASRSVRMLAYGGVAIGAVLVAVSAVIHLHLWMQGYKHIHWIGPLFLAQAVAGIGLALVMLVYPRLVSAVAGALYMAATIGGLLMSATVGIFGFHDGLDVPWATSSLVIEAVGLVVLVAAGAAFFARR